MSRISLASRLRAAAVDYVHAPACRRCRLRSRAGKLPVPITFTRRQAAGADYVHAPASCQCRLRSRAGKLPVSITFSRGKARLLCTNLHCYARTSGAAAHGAGFLHPPTRPLRCALRLFHQNLQVLFSIKLCRT